MQPTSTCSTIESNIQEWGMNDDQFEILDEPEEEHPKGKRKPKSRPLGIPWRWVLIAFAAGVVLMLLIILVLSVRITPSDSVIAAVPTLFTPPTPAPSATPLLEPSPPPLPTGFHLPGDYVEDVAWHGDTMAAATLSRLGLYQDLDWVSNFDVYTFDNESHDNFIDLAFSPDGTHLAAIRSKYWFQDGQLTPASYVAIWVNGEYTREFMAHSGRHSGFITRYLGVAVAYSHDGRLMATGAGNGDIMLWETVDYQPVAQIFTGATGTLSLAFSDDGQHLTALLRGDDDTSSTTWIDSGDIQVWNVSDPQNPVKEPFTKHLQREVGLKAAISPNGQFAAFVDLMQENQCCAARALQIWDVYGDSLALEIPLDESGSTIENMAFSDDSDSLTFVEQHIIEDESGYGVLQNDLRVFGWQKGADNSYQLQDMGGQFNIDDMPYELHINDAGTWVQYITYFYNIVERWYIATNQVQDMSL
jgi:WD40 repeat protein